MFFTYEFNLFMVVIIVSVSEVIIMFIWPFIYTVCLNSNDFTVFNNCNKSTNKPRILLDVLWNFSLNLFLFPGLCPAFADSWPLACFVYIFVFSCIYLYLVHKVPFRVWFLSRFPPHIVSGSFFLTHQLWLKLIRDKFNLDYFYSPVNVHCSNHKTKKTELNWIKVNPPDQDTQTIRLLAMDSCDIIGERKMFCCRKSFILSVFFFITLSLNAEREWKWLQGKAKL